MNLCMKWGRYVLFLIVSAMFAGAFPCGYSQAPAKTEVIQVGDPDLIAATLSNWLDAGHVKVGQVYPARIDSSWVLEGCTIQRDTLIKVRIEGASKRSKETKESTLALSIDPVTCAEKSRPPVVLKIVALIAPDYETGKKLLQGTPVEVSGKGKQIDDVDDSVMRMSAHLDPDGNTRHIRPGQVFGLKHLVLHLEGGPQASTLLLDNEENVRLGSNTRLMVTEQYHKAAGAPGSAE
jgi:hypothetical protein